LAENGDTLLASGGEDSFIAIWRFTGTEAWKKSPGSNPDFEFQVQYFQNSRILFDSMIIGHEGWINSLQWNQKGLTLTVTLTLIHWFSSREAVISPGRESTCDTCICTSNTAFPFRTTHFLFQRPLDHNLGEPWGDLDGKVPAGNCGWADPGWIWCKVQRGESRELGVPRVDSNLVQP
jgi:hypothetical protein